MRRTYQEYLMIRTSACLVISMRQGRQTAHGSCHTLSSLLMSYIIIIAPKSCIVPVFTASNPFGLVLSYIEQRGDELAAAMELQAVPIPGSANFRVSGHPRE